MVLILFKRSVSLLFWAGSSSSYLPTKAVALSKRETRLTRKLGVLTILGQLVSCGGFSEGVEKQLSEELGRDSHSCYAMSAAQL